MMADLIETTASEGSFFVYRRNHNSSFKNSKVSEFLTNFCGVSSTREIVFL